MPCDSIRTIGVVLKDANLDILETALKDMKHTTNRQGNTIYFGQGESYNRETNELRVRNAETAATIKRAYSAVIVKTQARRYGWTLKETAPYQFEVIKR